MHELREHSQISRREVSITLRQQFLDLGFEFRFFGKAEVFLNYVALAINDEGRRDGVNAAKSGLQFIAGEADGVIHAELIGKFLDGAETAFIYGSTHNQQTLRGVLFLQGDKAGNFLVAGAAPGGPKIENDHFAFEVGGLNGLAVKVLERPIRGGPGGNVFTGGPGAGDDEQRVNPEGEERDGENFGDFHITMRAAGEEFIPEILAGNKPAARTLLRATS